MIGLITSFGIGAALGGVTLYLGYSFGYSRGHAAGYKLARDAANSARSTLGDMLPILMANSFIKAKPKPAEKENSPE